jgi:hypothetical protein
MIWMESNPGNTTVQNKMVKMIELAKGTVRTAIEVLRLSKIPGIYPIKNSMNDHAAQNK